MSTPVDSAAEVPMTPTRPLYWSVRRELWENRSVYIAPLIVIGVVLFGFFFSNLTLPKRIARLATLDPAKQEEILSMPYNAAAGALLFTAFFVGVFYCLDALYGERRDRSILFWKSLPVSDRTIVLSKAVIPIVVMPALVYVLAVVVWMIMAVLNTAVLLANQQGLELLWRHLKFSQSVIALLYGVIVIALWHAPVYAWLLLISGWAKRAAVLWAVLPLLAIGALEKMIFNSTYFFMFLGYRLMGWLRVAFDFPPKGSKVVVEPLAQLRLGNFLSTPGLWFGLLFAAAFLFAAVRLRRNREPI